MKRQWFRDTDGTYYRNCPLIMDEWKRAIRLGRFFLASRLGREWDTAFRQGVIRKNALTRGDTVVQPRPFREAYPDRPGLWTLDGTGNEED